MVLTFNQRSVAKVSFEITWLIAENKKPFTIDEGLIKLAVVKMVEIMCCQKERGKKIECTAFVCKNRK